MRVVWAGAGVAWRLCAKDNIAAARGCCERREKSTSEDAGLRGRRLKGALPMYASLVLCFLVFTCRLCMYPHTPGPVIYPLSIKH